MTFTSARFPAMGAVLPAFNKTALAVPVLVPSLVLENIT